METEREKFDRGDSKKQYIERSDEELGLLELLISAVKDSIDAIRDFHQNPFIRLAENEFGIHPHNLLYWWSLKKTDPRAYRRQITALRLEGTYDIANLEAAVKDYDRRRRDKIRKRVGLKVISGH